MTENETLWNWGNHQKYHADLENYIGTKITEHASDTVSHITADERTAWNEKTTLDECAETFINPNLIINSNLKINQRGQTEYTTPSEMFVDCWGLYKYSASTADKAIVHSDGGITLVLAEGNWIRPIQEFVNPLTEPFTVSVEIETATPGIRFDLLVLESGSEYNISTNLLSGEKQTIIATYTPTSATNLQLNLRNTNGFGEVRINHVKLEPGLIATPHVDSDEALELVKCQRYYKELTGLFPISIMTHDLVYCDIPIGDMRITPTVSFKTDIFDTNNGIRVVDNGGVPITGFEFSVVMVEKTNSVEIIATKEGHGLSRDDALICVDIDNPVCLSAEL